MERKSAWLRCRCFTNLHEQSRAGSTWRVLLHVDLHVLRNGVHVKVPTQPAAVDDEGAEVLDEWFFSAWSTWA
jgi:hypothetical protein